MFRVLATTSVVVVSFVSASSGAITASSVLDYVSAGEPTFNIPESVLGLPPRSGPFGDLTPFSPNFGSNNILRILPGGSITLRLSESVSDRKSTRLNSSH